VTDINTYLNGNTRYRLNKVFLDGYLCLPAMAKGLVIFAHSFRSDCLSSLNLSVATYMNQRGLATLLVDLFSEEEKLTINQNYSTDITPMGRRITAVVDWATVQPDIAGLKQGLFSASTGAAAALIAAAKRPGQVCAVVSRGGRPDLAETSLAYVDIPTLLIVGENDSVIVSLNINARQKLKGERKLEIIPGTSLPYQDSNVEGQVAELASDWFLKHLPSKR